MTSRINFSLENQTHDLSDNDGVMQPGTERHNRKEELGRLGLQTSADRLRATSLVRDGEVLTLGLPLFGGNPVANSLDRPRPFHVIYRDWSHYRKGSVKALRGGVASVDDGMFLNCHGGTHIDALGHIMHEGLIFGGRSADHTVGGLDFADVAVFASMGIVCRAVLADLPTWKGEAVAPDSEIMVGDVRQCLKDQGVEIGSGDMLLIRTGSLSRWMEVGQEAFFRDYSEPGFSDDPALFEWIDEGGILGLGTDTFANELPTSPRTGEEYPLHRHLLRDRGMQFHEALWLEDLAVACARDGRYEGLYIVAPLNLVGASGSPVNPIFMR
jgi:kynurenine formamidase